MVQWLKTLMSAIWTYPGLVIEPVSVDALSAYAQTVDRKLINLDIELGRELLHV